MGSNGFNTTDYFPTHLGEASSLSCSLSATGAWLRRSRPVQRGRKYSQTHTARYGRSRPTSRRSPPDVATRATTLAAHAQPAFVANHRLLLVGLRHAAWQQCRLCPRWPHGWRSSASGIRRRPAPPARRPTKSSQELRVSLLRPDLDGTTRGIAAPRACPAPSGHRSVPTLAALPDHYLWLSDAPAAVPASCPPAATAARAGVYTPVVLRSPPGPGPAAGVKREPLNAKILARKAEGHSRTFEPQYGRVTRSDCAELQGPGLQTPRCARCCRTPCGGGPRETAHSASESRTSTALASTSTARGTRPGGTLRQPDPRGQG